uniref:SFRICE_006240 n=1 Tax=Spodoptera frugiperda TaxID=7108 RepID=A0A2H1VY62_SPOFR
MDPILENESATTESPTKHGKAKHKNKKKKHSEAQNQTVVGERKRFVVTTLPNTEEKVPSRVADSNVHTVHFGTRGVESQRPHVRSIFKERPADTSRASSAERQSAPEKGYETFHGTSSSPRSSIFDIFRLRRKSDAKKYPPKQAKTTETQEAPESQDDQQYADNKDSHKKYYHTVTGASSRKYSPITRVMDIFRSKPHAEASQSTADPVKKKSNKQVRRSSIETTSPTYHKNSYASLDPSQAKQMFREVRGLPKYDPYLSIVQISIGELTFFHKTLTELKIGTFEDIVSVTDETSIKTAFQLLLEKDVSALPILDDNEKKVSSLQEIFRPLEENKVAESPKETENEIITIEVPTLAQNVPEVEEGAAALHESNATAEEETTNEAEPKEGEGSSEADANINTLTSSHKSHLDLAIDPNMTTIEESSANE